MKYIVRIDGWFTNNDDAKQIEFDLSINDDGECKELAISWVADSKDPENSEVDMRINIDLRDMHKAIEDLYSLNK